jgi:hypothetical protein
MRSVSRGHLRWTIAIPFCPEDFTRNTRNHAPTDIRIVADMPFVTVFHGDFNTPALTISSLFEFCEEFRNRGF